MGGFGFKVSVFGHKLQGTVLDPGAIGWATVRVPGDNGAIGKAINGVDSINRVPGTVATAIGDTVKGPGAIKDAANAAKDTAGSAGELIEKLKIALANAEHQAQAAADALKAATSSFTFHVITALVISALLLLVLLLGAKLYRTIRPAHL